MLYFDRPFSIGDWIRSPDRNIEGTVAEIGWRITKITTLIIVHCTYRTRCFGQ
ncbi:mechanosensitive ion channel domain-containing protein [Escherichia coli]